VWEGLCNAWVSKAPWLQMSGQLLQLQKRLAPGIMLTPQMRHACLLLWFCLQPV
jgi:hypothetical protein